MEAKLAKLQTATDEAETLVQKHKEALEDASNRVEVAKSLLRSLDAEEQSRILVSDTKLPELLGLQALAKEEYETSLQRYETNKRYLTLFREKVDSFADAGGKILSNNGPC